MTSLKLLHTSDFHLGAGLVGQIALVTEKSFIRDREKDFLRQLDTISRVAIKEQCDFVLITGDVFHTIRPTGLLFDEFAKFIATLTGKKIQVICIAGNHDSPKSLDSQPYLKGIRDANAPYFYFFNFDGDIHAICLEGERSKKTVGFICVPYIHPSTMLEMGGKSELSMIVRRKIASKIEQLKNCDYKIILAHFSLQGAKRGSEKYMISYDVELQKSDLCASEANYIAMGHIHSYQSLGDNIVYAGSIERVDFSEEDEKKGFVLIEEKGGDLHPGFVELDTRPFLTIPNKRLGITDAKLDLRTCLEPTQALLNLLREIDIPRGAVIRIKPILSETQQINKKKIEEFLKNKGAFYSYIKPDIIKQEMPKRIERGAWKNRSELFQEYVKAKYAGKIHREVLNLVLSEGQKIMEEVEKEEETK